MGFGQRAKFVSTLVLRKGLLCLDPPHCLLQIINKTIIKRLNTFIENCKNNPNLCDFNLINTEDGIILAKKVQNEK